MRNEYPVAPDYIKRFEQLGLGMFVHFGLYSLLKRGEWAMNLLNIDKKEYSALKDSFDPISMKEIVNVAKGAGCKYICLTTRHHDGFSLYDTKGLSDYDALHTPAGRDLIAEFVNECRGADIVPFFYHTTLDWSREDFESDFDSYLTYLKESVRVLCTEYGDIGGMWFDGNWSKPDADWKEDELYSMIRELQPEAMIINNTGLEARGALGNEYIDSVTYERGVPTPIDRRGMKKYVAGEMCETLNNHWGDADDINFKSVPQLIEEICACRKIGANMLLNIGPSHDGSIPLMSKAIMDAIGRWMDIYGDAVYNGRPFIAEPESKDFVLRDVNDESKFYLFKHSLGNGGSENVVIDRNNVGHTEISGFSLPVSSVRWLDNGEELSFAQDGDLLTVKCTSFPYGIHYCVRVAVINTKN
jgi:alpha-L-fucosidase